MSDHGHGGGGGGHSDFSTKFRTFAIGVLILAVGVWAFRYALTDDGGGGGTPRPNVYVVPQYSAPVAPAPRPPVIFGRSEHRQTRICAPCYDRSHTQNPDTCDCTTPWIWHPGSPPD